MSLTFTDGEYWELVRARYPTAIGALIYGSVQKKKQNSKSDVDLLVLLRSPSSPFRETFDNAGVLFDVFAYDMETLHGAMILERSAQSMVLVNIVADSVGISPATHVTKAIQLAARRLKIVKYGALELNTARHQITSLIDDIEAEARVAPVDRLAVDLYRAIYDLTLLSIGCGGFGGKHAARQLANKNQPLANDLRVALADALNGNSDNIIALGRTVLSGIGGELRNDYRAPITVPIRVPVPDSEFS